MKIKKLRPFVSVGGRAIESENSIYDAIRKINEIIDYLNKISNANQSSK